MIVGARQRNRLTSRTPSNTEPTANATGNPAPINGAGAAPQPTGVAQVGYFYRGGASLTQVIRPPCGRAGQSRRWC